VTRWTAADLARVNAKIAGDIAEPLAMKSGSTRSKVVRLARTEVSAEDQLAFQLASIPEQPQFIRQYRIHPDRKFVADFFFSQGPLVVEIDGGGYINGRHSRGQGIENDAEKSALIAAMPARLIRVTPKHVENGLAVQWILEALKR
jgi:very-short-patch-repair endonuclease